LHLLSVEISWPAYRPGKKNIQHYAGQASQANTQPASVQTHRHNFTGHTTKQDEMESHIPVQNPEIEHSATSPSPDVQTAPMNAIPTIIVTPAFEEDLEEHPENHFLTPMTAEERYYGWDSDSDDEDFDGEWNAGITDFSLFTSNRKRAMETGEPLDGKWDSFVAGQADVFERSRERVMRGSGSEVDQTPELTPDTSPHLKDDIEDDAEMDKKRDVMVWMPVPDYLIFEVKPSTSTAIGPDDDLPLSLTKAGQRRVERPGLKYSRTLSGKRHVWQEPNWDMPTVGEDIDAEEEAEQDFDQMVASTEGIGLGAE